MEVSRGTFAWSGDPSDKDENGADKKDEGVETEKKETGTPTLSKYRTNYIIEFSISL